VKVVVAGGAGLIGRALCASLVGDGHEVVVLSRDPAHAVAAQVTRVVEWAPGADGAWSDELREASAVVNLAGASIGRWPWTAGRQRLLRDSRLTATRSIVDTIAALPSPDRPGTLLSASGTDVYEGRDDLPANEATPPGSCFLARLCLDWEAEARRAEELGVRVVALRTSSVLAHEAPYLRVVSMPFRLFLGGRLGNGRQWVSWIHLDDVVRGYRWALESPSVTGPVNLSAPDPRRQLDYARALGTALHRPSWFPTPAWLIHLVLGGQASLALGSRRVWPAILLDHGFMFSQPHLEEALASALAKPVTPRRASGG
jgi:uncharacterized protein (TIGR01777 family)